MPRACLWPLHPIGFVQEGKAVQALAANKDMLAPEARVLRNGGLTLVTAECIAYSGVLLLEQGDRVPATPILYAGVTV